MNEEELSEHIDFTNRTTWARLNAEMYALMIEGVNDDQHI